MAARNAAPASLTTPGAAMGSPKPDALPSVTTPGGAHTLHIEYAVWSNSYRIIHTRPDGKRLVWRRGIATVEEARLRTRIVADICGYEDQL